MYHILMGSLEDSWKKYLTPLLARCFLGNQGANNHQPGLVLVRFIKSSGHEKTMVALFRT